MAYFTQLDKFDARHWPLHKIERLLCLDLRQTLSLALALILIEFTQIDDWQSERSWGFDNLYWLTACYLKNRPQRLMPAEELVETLLHGRDNQCSTNPHRNRDVIGGTLWLQLIDDPQPLLRKR